jgi:hypothetical protein
VLAGDRSDIRFVQAELDVKLWTARSPTLDEVRPGRCPACAAPSRPAGGSLGLHGHGLRERHRWGSVEPGGSAELIGVLLRRYRCRPCGAVVVVGPRGLVRRRLYSASAIAFALALYGVIKLSPAEVRRRVSPLRKVGPTAAAGWASLGRWCRAVRARRLLPTVRAAPVDATLREVAARAAIGDANAPRGGTAFGDNGRFTHTLTRLTTEVAQKLLPGVALSPQQLAELSVFRVPKLNAVPRQPEVVLQAVPTRWGLVLREYEAAKGQTETDRRKDTRRSTGVSLQALAAKQQAAGRPLTASKLNGGLFKDIPGLTKNGIEAAITAAIEDGFLHSVERKGERGGGHALLPGPGEKREGSGVQ